MSATASARIGPESGIRVGTPAYRWFAFRRRAPVEEVSLTNVPSGEALRDLRIRWLLLRIPLYSAGPGPGCSFGRRGQPDLDDQAAVLSGCGVDVAAVGVGDGSHDGQSQARSEEHTSELQSRRDLVCRLLLEK